MAEPSLRRLLACADAHTPKGWRLSPGGKHPDDAEDNDTLGYADFATRTLVYPLIVDRLSLCVALHECGHVNLGHGEDHDDFNVTLEWEAETYAWKAMRAFDIPVPRSQIVQLREYLREIYEDRHSGAYANCAVEPPDHVMRFIYGPRWRSGRVDSGRKVR